MRTFFGVEIPKKNTKCSKLSEDILPGDEIYSVLKNLDDNYIREDYCSSCWSTVQNELEESVVLNWKSIVSQQKPRKDLFMSKDQQELSLFTKLAASDSLMDLHQAYILSLYLSRKKQIYFRKEFQNDLGQTLILYEFASNEENIIIKKFEFSELDLSSIQKAIADSLKTILC